MAIANVALKVPGIDSRGLWLDEARTVWLGLQGLPAIVAAATHNQNPPFYNLLMAGWIGAFGPSELAVRAASVLASAACAVAILLLARHFFGGEAALYASIFFAASEPQLYYAREARAYALLGLLCVVSFGLYLRCFERPTRSLALALGLVNAIGLYTHFAIGLAFVAELACAFLFVRRAPRGFAYYVASQVLTLFLFAPWIGAFRTNLPEAGTFWLRPPGSVELLRVVAELSGGKAALLAGLAVIVVAGAFAATRRRSLPASEWRPLVVLAAWAILPVALGFAISQRIPVFYLRYQLYASIGWWLLLAVFVSRLPVHAGYRTTIAAIVALLSATRLDWHRVRASDWRAVSELAMRQVTRSTAIVVTPDFQCVPFAYYVDPAAFALPGPEALHEALAKQGVHCAASAEAAEPSRLGWPDRVVLLLGKDSAQESLNVLPAMEKEGYLPAGEWIQRGVTVRLLRRSREQAASPLDH